MNNKIFLIIGLLILMSFVILLCLNSYVPIELHCSFKEGKLTYVYGMTTNYNKMFDDKIELKDTFSGITMAEYDISEGGECSAI